MDFSILPLAEMVVIALESTVRGLTRQNEKLESDLAVQVENTDPSTPHTVLNDLN
jgi:hypothetical protein